MGKTKETKFAWKLYNPITETEAPPTLNTYHTHLDLAICKLHYVIIEQNNDEIGAKEVTIKATIDGDTIETSALSLQSGELYYLYLAEKMIDPIVKTLGITVEYGVGFGLKDEQHQITEILEMQACKIEIKQTDALGTNQTLVTIYRKSLLEAVS